MRYKSILSSHHGLSLLIVTLYTYLSHSSIYHSHFKLIPHPLSFQSHIFFFLSPWKCLHWEKKNSKINKSSFFSSCSRINALIWWYCMHIKSRGYVLPLCSFSDQHNRKLSPFRKIDVGKNTTSLSLCVKEDKIYSL